MLLNYGFLLREKMVFYDFVKYEVYVCELGSSVFFLCFSWLVDGVCFLCVRFFRGFI